MKIPARILRSHGRGHQYQKAIPKELRPLFGGRKIKAIYYDVSVSASEAQRRAMMQWVADSEEFERLGKLSTAELSWLADHGGTQKVAEAVAPAEASVAASKEFMASLHEIKTPPAIEIGGKRIEISRAAFLEMAERYRSETATLEPTIETAKALVAKASRKGPHASKLAALLDVWQTVVAPRDPRTREKYGKSLDLFAEAVGDMPPADVTQAHATKFRDWLGDATHGLGHARSTRPH